MNPEARCEQPRKPETIYDYEGKVGSCVDALIMSARTIPIICPQAGQKNCCNGCSFNDSQKK